MLIEFIPASVEHLVLWTFRKKARIIQSCVNTKGADCEKHLTVNVFSPDTVL